MAELAISEFADKVSEIKLVISREFYRLQSSGFYKMQITVPQFAVLDTLVREEELRMSDLARILNVTTAAMTGIIDRLVRCGYVKRETDSSDRRIIKVIPTAKGSRVVKNAIEGRKVIVGKMFGMISENERNEYLRILSLVKDNIKQIH